MNITIIDIWNAASLLYAVAIEAIREYSTLSQAEVTANWLTSIQEIEKPYQDENALEAWTKVANKFRQSNGTELLHVYYRGFPHMLLRALSAPNVLERVDSSWATSMVDEATQASAKLTESITIDPDSALRHRLQVFPLLPAIQSLSLVDETVHADLCNRVTKVLRDTQKSTHARCFGP